MSDDDLKYPVGRFQPPATYDDKVRGELLGQIEQAPALLRAAVSGLSEAQIDTPYRPGGWTVRQVAHHLPDSHMNGFTRCRLALTEVEPLIRPYMEDRWAELPDSRTAPVEMSLSILEPLHQRWLYMLRRLGPDDWKRTFKHPDTGVASVERTVALYAWHGRHHVAHVTQLRERSGWR